jgi:single-strand DNA-binding protein
VTNFTVAVDKPGKDKGADFIRCTAFDKIAENICRYMDKGRQIAIEGRINTGSYEKDGQKINTYEIVVERAEFIGRPEERSQSESYHNYGDYSEAKSYRRFDENEYNTGRY